MMKRIISLCLALLLEGEVIHMTVFKRGISFLLSVVIIFATLPLNVLGVNAYNLPDDPYGTQYDLNSHEFTQQDSGTEQISVWDGGTDTQWDRDSNGAYLISSAAELSGLAHAVNTGSISNAVFRLTTDIDLQGAEGQFWTPIGNEAYPCYEITFNGNGHTIYNLYIESSESYQGLFGKMSYGSIGNLNLENPNVCGDKYVGAVAGHLSNCEVSKIVVSNAHIKGTANVGGISGSIGLSAGNALSVCVTKRGSVTGEQNVGGITGIFSGPTWGNGAWISSCYNTASVTGDNDIGGIIGTTYTDGSNVDTTLRISSCTNTGTINGRTYVGGIVGYSNVLLMAEVFIENCYNVGIVSASDSAVYSSGGILGNAHYFRGGDLFINYSYNAGHISGRGIGSGATNIRSSFFLSGASTEGGDNFYGTPVSFAEMCEKDTYTGWDFDKRWAIDDAHNTGIPYLQWAEEWVQFSDNNKEKTTVSVRYFTRWDEENQIAYFDQTDYVGSQITEETDTAFLDNIDTLIGRYVLVETRSRNDNMIAPDTLLSINSVETYVGTVTTADAQFISINGIAYTVPENLSMPELYSGEFVRFHLHDGALVGIFILQTGIGMLQFWNTETRKMSIVPDGVTADADQYILSELADENSLDFLGVTGHTKVFVQYKVDNNHFVYRINQYSPAEAPDYYDTYIPMTPNEELFFNLGADWLNAYNVYVDAVYNAMMEMAGSDEEKRENIISRRAVAMQNSDSNQQSKYLSGNLGEYSYQAYLALADFLYEYTCKNAEFELDEENIINNVTKAMWNGRKEYVYENVTIRISAFGYGTTSMGTMTIAERGASTYSNIMICSNEADTKEAIGALLDELKGLSVDAAYAIADAVYEDILGKNLFELTEEYVSDVIKKIERRFVITATEKFDKAGVGDLIHTLDDCYTYYSWVIKAVNNHNIDDIHSAMDAVRDLNFEDTSIKDYATKKAMKRLRKAVKSIECAYENYIQSPNNGNMPVGFKAFINCPVNVRVFGSSGELIGYVSDDDIWYSDTIRILETGETKEFISRSSEPLSFEMIATDFGGMSCSFEEYGVDGKLLGRLNYYDILLEPEQKLSIVLKDDLKSNSDSIVIETADGAIHSNEYIDVSQNGDVTIKCAILEGGSVTGVGSHIRGDAVVLNAIPNNGYRFAGWFDGDALVCCNEVYSFTATHDRNLTAKFYRDDLLQVSVVAEYGGNAVGNALYMENEIATVIATPGSNYQFMGWFVDGERASPEQEDHVAEADSVKLHARFWCITHTAISFIGFSWANDYSECMAGIACDSCSFKLWMTAPIKTKIIPPTETEEGMIVYTATIGFNGQDYSDTKIVAIPATGHIFEASIVPPSCTEQGYTTYTCKCGESYVADYVDALGHSFGEWVVITEPTTTEDGLEERSCSRCGYTELRTVAELENPFNDVAPGSFYYEPVMWAIENGITNGTSATTFGPNDQCMRAHVVTFLWRAVGSPEPTRTDNPFVDVKPTDFYYKPVLWAVENGITSGMDATHFGPTVYCNRAQVVTFLYRTMGSPEIESAENPFTDVAHGSFYEKPVLWAVVNGVTSGMSATSFGPSSICNRAQIVTFLYRAFVND